MANINKIRLSGQTYNIQDPNAQPLLTAGQGITIENNVISATGGGGSSYTAGDGIDITNDVISVTGKTDSSAFTAYTAATNSRLSEDEEVTAAGLNALNDKINPTVELTQAQYDALVSGGTVNPNTYYIITDAQPVDISNYWTSAQTNSAINAAVSGKQDTLVSGTNIKTINNESLLGSGNIDIQGGGKAIEAGRGIAVTTGETADTVSFNLPISAGTGVNSLIIAGARTATGQRSIAIGYNSAAGGTGSIAINQSEASGQDSFSQGTSYAKKTWSSAFGQQNYSNNDAELSCGHYNKSVSASTNFGNSGNTLFSVGNGTANNARHNAFEIRQNGDIYITSGGTDIKLQDNLGGVEISSAITSGDTNAVAGGAVYDKLDEIEQVTARALNELAEANEVIARALNDLNDRITVIEARLNNS